MTLVPNAPSGLYSVLVALDPLGAPNDWTFVVRSGEVDSGRMLFGIAGSALQKPYGRIVTWFHNAASDGLPIQFHIQCALSPDAVYAAWVKARREFDVSIP